MLAVEVRWLQEQVASLQTKEQEACQHIDEADDKLKVVVAKAEEDVVEHGRLCLALDLAHQESTDARCPLKNEQKLNEEAEGLAAAVAGDVGVL